MTADGPPGAQGEPGVAGQAGEPGHTGTPGRRGRAGPALSAGRVLALAGFVVFVFMVLAGRQEIQQRSIARAQLRLDQQQQQITHNLDLIRQTQYDQCQLRNEGTARQNALIDSAIAAERRKPAPDRKRIADLTAFKGVLLNCGTPPT